MRGEGREERGREEKRKEGMNKGGRLEPLAVSVSKKKLIRGRQGIFHIIIYSS